MVLASDWMKKLRFFLLVVGRISIVNWVDGDNLDAKISNMKLIRLVKGKT